MEQKKFVNLSNHLSAGWDENQRKEALKYGEIVDIAFPNVPPTASKNEVSAIADRIIKEVEVNNPAAVMCQGEFTLTYELVKRMKESGILALAACSERIVEQKGAEKIVKFQFVRFREY